MYALILNDEIVKYPVTLSEEFPNTSFSDAPTSEVLAEFGIVLVSSVDSPEVSSETQYVKEGNPAVSNGKWVQTWEIVDAT